MPKNIDTLVSTELDIKVENSTNSYKAYESFSPVFTNAAVSLLYNMGEIDLLERPGYICLDSEDKNQFPEGRYLKASLDFLVINGFLKIEDSIYFVPTEKGKELFTHSYLIKKTVETYTDLMHVLCDEIREEVTIDTISKPKNIFESQTLLVPAVSCLYEKKIKSGPFKNQSVVDVLMQDRIVNVNDINDGEIRPNLNRFLDVLFEMGFLDGELSGFKATEKGKKIFKVGGYAELIASYYEMLSEMYPLMQGDLVYGLNSDINRDGFLNANASNGILKLRVAPYIVDSLIEQKELSNQLCKENSAFVDFGSGGGDMLMQVAETIDVDLFGLDISSDAISTAEENVEKKGLSNKIKFQQGSIVSKNDMLALRDSLGTNEVVSSINFIMHDVGEKMSKDFLKNYSDVFGSSPLVITESLRMPIEVLKSNPNYQAASFEFMHRASGQELFFDNQLRNILETSGFDIITEKVHSSMPNVSKTLERKATIVTWVVRARV